MDMRPDHRPIDCRHNQHRKRAPFKALLVFHVLVSSKKHAKAFALDQLAQRTVFDASPSKKTSRLRLELMLGAIVENSLDGVDASFRVAVQSFSNGRVR
jgi:hypothetical protein